MRPLQLANPVTDTPIVTEGNQAYGICTRHAETAAEDEEYIHMNSAEATIQPRAQTSIGMPTSATPTFLQTYTCSFLTVHSLSN